MPIYEVNIIYTFHYTAKDDIDALKRANQIVHTHEESKTCILFSKTVRLVNNTPSSKEKNPTRRLVPYREFNADEQPIIKETIQFCARLTSIDVQHLTWWRLKSRGATKVSLWNGPVAVTHTALTHDHAALSYMFSDTDLQPLLDDLARILTGHVSGEFMLNPISRELVKLSDVNELVEATAPPERLSPRDQPDSPWETIPLRPVEVYRLSPPDELEDENEEE